MQKIENEIYELFFALTYHDLRRYFTDIICVCVCVFFIDIHDIYKKENWELDYTQKMYCTSTLVRTMRLLHLFTPNTIVRKVFV